MKRMIFNGYLLLAVCFMVNSLAASEQTSKDQPLTFEQQKAKAIDNLRQIIREFDIIKLGIDAIPTNKLSTDELLLKVISALNFTIKVRAYLLSIAPVEQAVSHELFHATNHINNINKELDLAESESLPTRASYVRLYRYSLPVMMNIIQDVVLKAVKALTSEADNKTDATA